MPEHKHKPVSGKPAAAQSAAKAKTSTVARQESVRGSGFPAPAVIPAAELAEVEYFRRSRDTAAEGFKRVRGTRPTGRG